MAKSTRERMPTPAPAAASASPQTAPDPTLTPGSRLGPRLAGKGGVKVRATKMGYYDNKRRRIGDVFLVAEGDALSATWMTLVDRKTPEKITTGAEALQQFHDDKVGGKAMPGTGDIDVLGE